MNLHGCLFLLASILPFTCYSQAKPHDYYIRFKDRANTPFSVNKPLQFLSERAVERRQRHNIAIDERDMPVNSWYIDSLRNTGAKVLFSSRWFNSATIETKDTTGEVLRRIKLLPFVDSPATQLLRKRSLKIKSTGELTDSSSENTYSTKYGYAFRQIDMCNGIALHKLGYAGQGMLIAIIDAGFFHADKLYAFRDLRDGHRILSTRNFVDSASVFDGATHGMFVLSTMAGNIPRKLLGVAPDASFLLLQSENDTSEYPVEEDAWVAAAEYADSAGADVINSSLGYTTFDNPLLNNSYNDLNGKTLRISIAANIAIQKGMIIMNSAGNSGAQPWHFISAPADAIDILTVGAVDSDENITAFSSRGPSYDGRIKPDVCAMGRNTVAASSTDSTTIQISGTSLSSPLITGLTACLWQAFPDKTNLEIMDAIRTSSNHAWHPDNDYGYGIPDYGLAYRLLKEESRLGGDYLFDFSPNPFQAYPKFDFYSHTTQTIYLTIIDMEGRIIYSGSYYVEANTVLDRQLYFMTTLPHGLYLACVRASSGVITRKLIKD